MRSEDFVSGDQALNRVPYAPWSSDYFSMPDKTLSARSYSESDSTNHSLNLDQLLNDFKTPFVDAYIKSKREKDGTPGKLLVLASTIDRMKSCPWSEKIRIRFDSTIPNPDYDPIQNQITINPKDMPPRQIQLFVHEAYHATHQSIGALLLIDKPASLDKYIDCRMNDEVGAFASEVRAGTELNNEQPIKFSAVINGGIRNVNLADIYNRGGFESLKSFLLDAKPLIRENGAPQYNWLTQEPESQPCYRDYYQRSYPQYIAQFHTAHSQAIELLKNYQRRNPGLTKIDFVRADF